MVVLHLERSSLKTRADSFLADRKYDEAIRSYWALIVSEIERAEFHSFNLSYSRRRWRSDRIGQPPTVAVCGWELSHNAAGRVRALADIWSGIADTEIIGATFAHWSDKLWVPIRNTNFPCHTIHVVDDRQFIRQALELVLAYPYDIVHLSKPRMPNIVFGLLYKLIWDAQVIVDIDDEELGAFKDDTLLSLEALKEQQGGALQWDKLPFADWTRVAVGFADRFDSVTVSNSALQCKYGGTVLPHARPACWFENDRRAQSRAAHGIEADKTVVLFFGTPRKHKGLLETARAIAALGRDDLCYLIVGDFPDLKIKAELEAIEGLDLRFLPGQPYDAIPEIVALGDVCVLLQSDSSLIARYQVPAKLVDALAAGLLVLAQPTPGMMEFVERGVVVPTSAELLSQTLGRWIDDKESADRVRARGQEYFFSHLSVESCKPLLAAFTDSFRPRPDPRLLLESPTLKSLFDELGGWQMFRDPEARPVAQMQSIDRSSQVQDKRVVVYSVLVGDYEAVKEPEALDPSARYILFTDNASLKSDRWEVVPFDTLGLSPRRASRLPKLLPHRYLPEHDISIYLDSSLSITDPDVRKLAKDALQGLDIAGYAHFERDCIYDEIAECLKQGKADPGLSEAFRKRLEKEQFPQNWGLLENAFLIRRDTPEMRRINELWCKEYLEGAERDQFSLMYVLWRAGIPHSTIGNAPQFRKSPHLRFQRHLGAEACVMAKVDTEALSESMPFLTAFDPKTLAARVEKAIEAIGPEQRVSTRLMHEASEALALLEMQASDYAQKCRNMLSRSLFPRAAGLCMNAVPKLAYIPNAAMPTSAANNVHVMKMCAALVGAGVDVTLYSERDAGWSGSAEELQESFGTFRSFPVVFEQKDERGRENLLYRLVCRAIADGCTHLYTRSLEVALYACLADLPVILEEHKVTKPENADYLQVVARSPALEKLVVISGPLAALYRPIHRELHRKIVVMHDAADPPSQAVASFPLRQAHGTSLNLGYVGHLYPGKGAELSLEIARRMPNVTVHMLGGKPNDVKAWQEKAREVPNIIFYGHRPHNEVDAFIASIDVCIAPFLRQVQVSGGKYNVADFFSPLKIFEYMAHGKPIVTSDLPVLREVLTDGETALMCDPDRPETFVAALEKLIADPALGKETGARAKSAFMRNHTWSRRAERVRDILTAKPDLEAPPAKLPARQGAALNDTDKPVVRWYFGGEKQAGWAYGINARRLSSRIHTCRHIAPGSPVDLGTPVDVALAFDILIMAGEKFLSSGAKRKILRVGGPNPLQVYAGGNDARLAQMLAQADAIIALSPQLRDNLAALHESVHFIPNGIDTAAFAPGLLRREFGQPFTVGMSASMSKESQRHVKGYYFATEACERVGVDLLVVGRGTRQIPHERLIDDFYSKIDVLIHPVGAGKEASSNVIMEALALGIPVITTRHAGFHGVALEHGREGLLMRRTVADFAEAIGSLQANPDLCQALGAGGRGFAERHHALDVVAREYEDVIWKCLKK